MRAPADKLQLLKKLTTCNAFFYPHSRSHLLKQSFSGNRCFIKREDELGGIFNGSKVRKQYSLLPFLVNNSIQKVLLKGGAYSNAVASLVPLLIENNIKPVLFLRGEDNAKIDGNLFYLNLFKDCCDIHWVNREDWATVDHRIEAYKNSNDIREKIMVLPEGTCCNESLLGALTLAVDVFYNQQELQVVFDHIFIEAGTGSTAIALILGLQYLESPVTVHVLHLPQGIDSFHAYFNQFHGHFLRLMPNAFDNKPVNNYTVYSPTMVSSFGAVTSKITQQIKNFAKTEGIVLDPIYAAPLFIEAPLYIERQGLQGNFLFIHNGGTLATIGYKQKFLP